MNTIQALSSNELLTQSEGHIVSDMGGEKVMLSVKLGKYFNLGEIGGQIWALLSSPISVEQIVHILTTEYDVEPAACREQVLSFLENMHAEGLIRRFD